MKGKLLAGVFFSDKTAAVVIVSVAGRAFHAEAFSDIILNTPRHTFNMTPRLENPYRITSP